ncbi:hypothetical protein NQ314_006415 [Rhamnusium bicolor]|uniref:Uncharacterized protein n=1 Tax=Rhamnusium bicolor TaxID=1586634 RepID=A0AAV8Z463_9CUCU|nr:hypothetical protein NQ314_006415 [Rhamnusium bicolor]
MKDTRESYGDKAIGYVQLKRVNHICTVKAKVTPEYKIHNKYYNVIIEVDEAEEIILSCKCLDCAASEGWLYILFKHF